MFAKSAPIAARLVHNRNRSHVPGLDDNVHGTVGTVFLAHHTALVFCPGKTEILFESGYAHPGPSLLGKRQGQYGVCRADSTVARTLWQTGPLLESRAGEKGPAVPACKGRNAGSTQERPAPEANLGRAREWSKVMRNQHPAQGQGKCPQQGTGKRSCAKDGGSCLHSF